MANGVYSREIQLRHGDLLPRAALVNDAAPRLTDHGVAPRHIAAALVTGRGGTHGEQLVIHCPLPQQQFPVGGAGGHVEGRRSQDHPGAPQGHHPAKLLEPQVKAHAQPHPAPRGIQQRDVVSGGKGVGLHEVLSPLHVDIEEVYLPVPGRLPPLIVVDVAGVVKPLPLPLRDGAAHDPDAQFPAQSRQGLLGRAALLLAVGAEHLVFIGAAEHLRQHHQLRPLLRRPVEVCLASEFRYCDPLVDDHSLVIFISQSGETLDTMAALREAKRRGGRTLAVVNVVGSSIAREADDVLYTWAGPEIAVATTKAYSTQLVLMDLIALYLGDLLGTIEKTEYDTILHELEALPEKLERVLASIEDVKYFASRYFNHDSIFFIGRNLDYAMGLEGSLKLKEISYIHSEAYASGELKHGTISLIEPGTLVVALGTYEPLFDKAMSNVVEVKARGAEVLALATEPLKEKMAHTADSVIAVPETHPVVQPSLGVVPLQLFAYYVALQRGCDIDKPRNLAKSVTVE